MVDNELDRTDDVDNSKLKQFEATMNHYLSLNQQMGRKSREINSLLQKWDKNLLKVKNLMPQNGKDYMKISGLRREKFEHDVEEHKLRRERFEGTDWDPHQWINL